MWIIQNLREQALLLETVLLYYKDYQHPPTALHQTVLIMQVYMLYKALCAYIHCVCVGARVWIKTD